MPSLSSAAQIRENRDAEDRGGRHERAAIANLVRARGCICVALARAGWMGIRWKDGGVDPHHPDCPRAIALEIEARGAAPKAGEERAEKQ